MKSIVFVVSSLMTVRAFLLPHIEHLSRYYRIYVIVNCKNTDLFKGSGLDIQVIYAPIERTIAPVKDIRAFFRLYILFKKLETDMIFSISPKAGLLAMLAGTIARIPVRVHFFTGQIWKTRTGMSRWLLKCMDRLLAASTTYALVDSHSQYRFLIEQGIVDENNSGVLADGSVCGVNTGRFRPDSDKRNKIRRDFNLDNNTVVFLYLGRLKRDKGVIDLAMAFNALAQEHPEVFLLIVGPDEENLVPQLKRILENVSSKCIFLEYTDQPEAYLTASDVFCLPSYREGFGSVIIEAAATGIPAIGSQIYGIDDAIIEGVTGMKFPAGNQEALMQCMKEMLDASELRSQMGKNACQRARKLFSEERLISAMQDFISRMLDINQ